MAGDTVERHDDEEATLLITEAAEHLSKADLSTEIADALAMGAMTALMKDNGRIKGIVTGGHFQSRGGAHDGTTARFEVRPCLHAVPVRTLHASRNRLRRTCGQVFD